MATIDIRVGGVSVADHCLWKRCSFTSVADGNVGSATVVLDNSDHSFVASDFVAGTTLELYVDGTREWDGWIMVFARTWPFDVVDTTIPGDAPRFWTITGSDRNLLFQKRILFDKADPSNHQGLKIWAPDTPDRTALLYTLDNYVDLTGDGLSFDIRQIDSPSPWEEFTLGYVSAPMGTAFEECAQMTGGVFWIGPGRTLHYRSDVAVTAPWGLSDAPTGTQKGYREFAGALDFNHAATEAMVWGAGKGSSDPVFASYAANVNTYGRWQWGNTFPGAWLQQTVQRRARTYVEGSPTHRRGHGEPAPVVSCTIFEPGIRVGHVVDFHATLFGFNEPLPVRNSKMTFPTPSGVKYELELSLKVDSPFGVPDPWKTDPSNTPYETDWIPPEGPGHIGDAGVSTNLIDHFDREVETSVYYIGGAAYGPTYDGLPVTDSDSGFVTAFDADGVKIWSVDVNPFGWSECHKIAADDTGVYAQYVGGLGAWPDYSQSGLVKLHPLTGAVLWRYIATASADPYDIKITPEGVVYHDDAGSRILHFSRDGALLWDFNYTGLITYLYSVFPGPGGFWAIPGGTGLGANSLFLIGPYISSQSWSVAGTDLAANSLIMPTIDPYVFYYWDSAPLGGEHVVRVHWSGSGAPTQTVMMTLPGTAALVTVDPVTEEIFILDEIGGSPPRQRVYGYTRTGVLKWGPVATYIEDNGGWYQINATNGRFMVHGSYYDGVTYAPGMEVFDQEDGSVLVAAQYVGVDSIDGFSFPGAAVTGYAQSVDVTPGVDVTGADPVDQPGGNVWTSEPSGSGKIWVEDSRVIVQGTGEIDQQSAYVYTLDDPTGVVTGEAPNTVEQGGLYPGQIATPETPLNYPSDLLFKFSIVEDAARSGYIGIQRHIREVANDGVESSDGTNDFVASWLSEVWIGVYWYMDTGVPVTYVEMYPAYYDGTGILLDVEADTLSDPDLTSANDWSHYWWRNITSRLNVVDGTEYYLRFDAGTEVYNVEANAKYIRMKVWAVDDVEPVEWDISDVMPMYKGANVSTHLGHPNVDGVDVGISAYSLLSVFLDGGDPGGTERTKLDAIWVYGLGAGPTGADTPIFGNIENDQSSLYITSYPYMQGTLTVDYEGIPLRPGIDFVETDPSAGEFRILGNRDISSFLIARYVRRGTTPTSSGGSVYRPAPQLQYGWGTALDGYNCTMACSAMALDRHTLGQLTAFKGSPRSTPPNHRGFQNDQVGGTDIFDAALAWSNGWGKTMYSPGSTTWAYFVSNIDEGRGAILQGTYGNLPIDKRFSSTFTGGHAIYINERFSNGNFWGIDPLYRYPVIYTTTELQAYAIGLFAPGLVSAGYTKVT